MRISSPPPRDEASLDRVRSARVGGDVELTLAEVDVVGDFARLVHGEQHGRLVADPELLVGYAVLVGVLARGDDGVTGRVADRTVAVEVDHLACALCDAVLEGAVGEHEVVVGRILAEGASVVDAHGRGGVQRIVVHHDIRREELLSVAGCLAVGADGKGIDRVGRRGGQPLGPQIPVHTVGEPGADLAYHLVGRLRHVGFERQEVGLFGVLHGDRVEGMVAFGGRDLDRDRRRLLSLRGIRVRFILLAGEERYREHDGCGTEHFVYKFSHVSKVLVIIFRQYKQKKASCKLRIGSAVPPGRGIEKMQLAFCQEVVFFRLNCNMFIFSMLSKCAYICCVTCAKRTPESRRKAAGQRQARGTAWSGMRQAGDGRRTKMRTARSEQQ